MTNKHEKNHSQLSPLPSSSLVSTPTTSTLDSTDLIIKILYKLPVESVCKFKYVSKQWFDVVSDPYFIDMHEEFSLQNPKILVLKTVALEKRATRIDFRSPKLDENKTEFSFYLGEDEKEIRLVYSKLGLICFVSENRFYACNPGKREMFSLPHASICVRDEVNTGIGYVKESNEYVFVHLFHDGIYYNDAFYSLRCEVLRLRDGDGRGCEWKVIDAKCPYLVQGMGVLVNNVFYWMNKKYYSIVSFDLVKEEFGNLVSPPTDSRPFFDMVCLQKLVELGGNLCLVDDITCCDVIDIWVMKDYVNHEWVVEYRIDIREFSSSLWTTFNTFDWNGKIWIWVNSEILGALVYYDVEEGRTIKVDHPTVADRTWLVLYTGRLSFSIGTR